MTKGSKSNVNEKIANKKEVKGKRCCFCHKIIKNKNNDINLTITSKCGESLCNKCMVNILDVINDPEGYLYNDEFDATEYNQDDKSEVKKDKTKKDENTKVTFNQQEIIKNVLKSIKGQDDIVKRVVTTICNNIKTNDFILKKNIFLIGQSGSGKTLLFNEIFEYIDVPHVIVNATEYTESGYAGKDVEEVLNQLLAKVNYDFKKAKNGVIIIDEIDKKRTGSDYGKDVSGEGTIDAFLGMINGCNIPIYTDKMFGGIYKGDLDTRGITFVVMGAFDGKCYEDSLEYIRDKRLNINQKSIGFSIGVSSNLSAKELKYTPDDLVNYGLSRQFVARFDEFEELNKVTIEMIKDAMLNSNKSLLNAIKREFESYGVILNIHDDIIDELTKEAYDRKTGMRAIRNVINDCLDNARNELLNTDVGKYTECIINKEIVNDDTAYRFI